MRVGVRKVKLGRAGHDRSPAKGLRQSMQLRITTWHEVGAVGKWFFLERLVSVRLLFLERMLRTYLGH